MKSNKKLAFSISFMIFSMILMAYASFPLYSIFCQVTGFGGTTQVAQDYYHDKIGKRNITVRFDSNIAPDLNWDFYANQKSITVKPGQNSLIFYTSKNNAPNDVIGTATYNVTPDAAGYYFNKIQCFCFEEQLLKKNQEVQMPVSFYIDPEFENDPQLKNVNEITLSYNFFKVRDQ